MRRVARMALPVVAAGVVLGLGMVHPAWAQVKYGYAATERDAVEKLQYDFHYLPHQDLALDLRVLGRTIRSVLRRQGR